MSYPTRVNDFDDFKTQLQTNTSLQTALQTDPVGTLQNISQQPLNTDKWIYRIVVLALGLTIISITVGVILMVFHDKLPSGKEVPAVLTAIGSAAIGALTGLLAPSPTRQK